jgi:hypothetical protein
MSYGTFPGPSLPSCGLQPPEKVVPSSLHLPRKVAPSTSVVIVNSSPSISDGMAASPPHWRTRSRGTCHSPGRNRSAQGPGPRNQRNRARSAAGGRNRPEATQMWFGRSRCLSQECRVRPFMAHVPINRSRRLSAGLGLAAVCSGLTSMPPQVARLSWRGRERRLGCYVCITDSGGRGAVIGSACLCVTFQTPSSRRKMVVTRTAAGLTSSAPPTRAR